MAKRIKRVAWTKEHVRDLKAHSKGKTPVVKISKAMKRTPGAIRQKALSSRNCRRSPSIACLHEADYQQTRFLL